MFESATRNHDAACPLSEWVKDYYIGALDAQQSARLEGHLADCLTCCELVDTLADPSDATIQALVSLPSSNEDEPEFQRLESLLLSTHAGTERHAVRRLANPPIGPLPQLLGNYELQACIGRGAWGAVFQARHIKLDQAVAVKVLDTARLQSDQAVERFLQEMKAVGQLAHPNIVRATDAGEANGFHYLVMEFVEGIDAAELIQHAGPLPIADACEIVRQAAIALDYAHRCSWVHRDVKPSNLMITLDGTVKLLDLGVAGRRDDTRSDNDQGQFPLGTADYMAPEQWTEFDRVDARADIYSLGCTLYKLLTGRVPHPSDAGPTSDEASVLPIPSLADDRSDVKRGLDQIVGRMIAPDRDRRILSAGEVAQLLARWSRRTDLSALVARVSDEVDEASDSLSGVARRQSSRATRRRVLAGLVLVSTGAILTPWLMAVRPQRLRRAEWRDLEPLDPVLWLALEPVDEVVCQFVSPNRFQVRSQDMALINLGRTVSGVFSLQVAIQQDKSRGGAGLFFHGGQAGSDECIYHFQTIELRPDDGSTLPPTRRLLWSRWETASEAFTVAAKRYPLAEVPVEMDRDSAAQLLQLTIGRQGFPQVHWNGRALHQNQWSLSTEGRRLATLSANQASVHYLGRVGLVNSFGETTFLQPRLAYL